MKIESVKLDFKEKAQAKVGSLENAHHVPGGGNVKVRGQPSGKRLPLCPGPNSVVKLPISRAVNSVVALS